MVRTMGINHCVKTGVSTTVKSATAELRHLSYTVLLVQTGHDVEHQGPEDNEGIQREVRRDQEDQPTRLTHKHVSTVEPSKR